MIKRWFVKMCRDAWEEARNPVPIPNYPIGLEKAAVEEKTIDMTNSLHFNVLAARGGTILECRRYDRNNDRNRTTTHVIPDGEDVAKEIGNIVSMELLQG